MTPALWAEIAEEKERQAERKMIISNEEMEAISVMYRVVCAEGQESDSMRYLIKRIEKEKRRWKIKKKRGG